MSEDYKDIKIGCSGFILFEECYEYNENACYIADTLNMAEQFMIDCGYDRSDFRIDEISINDLLNDYGCSCGEYAMEKLTFENFKLIAKGKNINYESEKFDRELDLMVVNIHLKKDVLNREYKIGDF